VSGDENVKLAYHDDYYLPLPETHPFPMRKYPLLRELLAADGIAVPEAMLLPTEVSLETLERVHTRDYLQRLASGALSPGELRRLGLGWSPGLWRRARLVAQGTLLAMRAALADGIAGNLAGGTHHAFADRGEGYCLLNDVAIAVRALLDRGEIERALIVDVDVHQGNGTAAIFASEPAVFTLSLHGERNYPAIKMRSSLDIGLPDGTADEQYLAALRGGWDAALAAGRYDLVVYLAGVDPAAGDRLGRMRLSDAGLMARDRFVLEQARHRGIPIGIVLGGGYAATPQRTAWLHANTFRIAQEVTDGRSRGLTSVR
jgi:acetoin utilization deacetylase AcuC-like enzyme